MSLKLRRAIGIPLVLGLLYLAIEAGSNHNLYAAWLLAVLGSLLAIFQGFRFRRGEPYLVALYRNGMPGTGLFRSLPLLGIPFGILFLAWFLVAGLVAATANVNDWPHWARSVAVWGSFCYLSILMGLSMLTAFAPPQRLMPQWLKDEEAASIRRRRGWWDYVTLGGGILFILAGLVAGYAGVLGTQGVRGL